MALSGLKLKLCGILDNWFGGLRRTSKTGHYSLEKMKMRNKRSLCIPNERKHGHLRIYRWGKPSMFTNDIHQIESLNSRFQSAAYFSELGFRVIQNQ